MSDNRLAAHSERHRLSESPSPELDDAEVSRRLNQYRVASDSGVQRFMSKQAGNRVPPPRSLSKRGFDGPDINEDTRRRKSNHAPRPSAATFPQFDEPTSGEANRDPAWRTAPNWRRGTGTEQLTSREPRPQLTPGSTAAPLNNPWRRSTGTEQPNQTGTGSISRNLRPRAMPGSIAAPLNDPWRRSTGTEQPTNRDPRPQFVPGSTAASLNDPWRTNAQSLQRPLASAFGDSDAQTPPTEQPASENQPQRQRSRQRSHVSDSQDVADDSGAFNFDDFLNFGNDYPLGGDHANSPMDDNPPDNPPTDNPPNQPQPSVATAPTTARGRKPKRGARRQDRAITQYDRYVALLDPVDSRQTIEPIGTLPVMISNALNVSLDNLFRNHPKEACRVTNPSNHKTYVESGTCLSQHIISKKGPKSAEVAHIGFGCKTCGNNNRACVQLKRDLDSDEVVLVFYQRHEDHMPIGATRTDVAFWL
jgi:hypothetical protein